MSRRRLDHKQQNRSGRKLALIHVILDNACYNARYHHATLAREWLDRPGCRIEPHLIPPY
ncbi:MAG: hypothetical protein ACREDM_00405 [Methylocella sp.]